jgi:hypothetical protein
MTLIGILIENHAPTQVLVLSLSHLLYILSLTFVKGIRVLAIWDMNFLLGKMNFG